MFKKIIAPLALVIFLILPISNTYANTTENLSFGTSVKGNITETNQEDKYKINLTKPGKITIRANVSLKNSGLVLSDKDGNEIKKAHVDGGNEESPKVYTESFDLDAGTYYITFYRGYSATGSYTLKVDYKEVKSDSIEPNNGTLTAQTLNLNSQPLNGYITVSNEKDVYKISLPTSGKITINAKVSLKNSGVLLSDKDGNEIKKAYVDGGSEESPKVYTESFDLDAGTYYITFYRGYSATGAYTLGVSTTYSADQLYVIAYKAANNATNKGTQEAINEARKAIRDLKGTKASWAIGQFSGQVDKVQHKILVRILNAINKAQRTLKQEDINMAKAVIDPNLPINWKNSYSSAVDSIQNKLVNKAIEAHKKAIKTQSKVDIDAANALIAELKTSSSNTIVQWANAYFKK